MVSITGDPSFTFPKDWGKYDLPYNHVNEKVGDYFTLSGNTIIVNKDFKCIRMSAQCVFWGNYEAPEIALGIRLTDSAGTTLIDQQTDQHKTGGMLCNVVSPCIGQNIKKGYKISVYTCSSNNVETKIIGRNTHSYILVEKVF